MKTARQNKIIELVEKNEIETQEELGELLKNAGFAVTQATISRDIRELKLTKVAIDLDRQKYIVLRSHNSEMNEKYARILRDSFVSMAKAEEAYKPLPGDLQRQIAEKIEAQNNINAASADKKQNKNQASSKKKGKSGKSASDYMGNKK